MIYDSTGAAIAALGSLADATLGWASANVLTLPTLAWVIGCLNPVSAVLVGPFLGRWLAKRNRHALANRLQGAGWLALGIAQCAFLTFGWLSGLGGFRWAQALMIPAALANFAAWWAARRQGVPDVVIAMRRAIQAAEDAGRVMVEHTFGPQITAEFTDANGHTVKLGVASMRITPLTRHGDPDPTRPVLTVTGALSSRQRRIMALSEQAAAAPLTELERQELRQLREQEAGTSSGRHALREDPEELVEAPEETTTVLAPIPMAPPERAAAAPEPPAVPEETGDAPAGPHSAVHAAWAPLSRRAPIRHELLCAVDPTTGEGVCSCDPPRPVIPRWPGTDTYPAEVVAPTNPDPDDLDSACDDCGAFPGHPCEPDCGCLPCQEGTVPQYVERTRMRRWTALDEPPADWPPVVDPSGVTWVPNRDSSPPTYDQQLLIHHPDGALSTGLVAVPWEDIYLQFPDDAVLTEATTREILHWTDRHVDYHLPPDQCEGAVYSHAENPPERCGLPADHLGDCLP